MTDAELAREFEIEVDFDDEALRELRIEARQCFDHGGAGFGEVLMYSGGSFLIRLTPRAAWGEWEWTFLGLVHDLVAGIPALLAGDPTYIIGMYGMYGFELCPSTEAVYMSRSPYGGVKTFEEEEGWRTAFAEDLPPDERIQSDVEETQYTAPCPIYNYGMTPLQWRRLEKPIALERFVDQCLAAAGKTLDTYRDVLPAEAFDHADLRKLVEVERRARRAWDEFQAQR